MITIVKLVLVAAALALATGAAVAAQEDIGKREYEANCAVCHGPAGKGDGPMADILTQGAFEAWRGRVPHRLFDLWSLGV